MEDRPGITIRHEFKPGDIGALIGLHGTLYHREYGFDTIFESYVAETFIEFIRSSEENGRIWIVEGSGEIVGCIGVMSRPDRTAQLRWLLVHPRFRGRGLGEMLMKEALDFSKEHGFTRIYLLTQDILEDAARMYLKFGFELVDQSDEEEIWGARMRYQRYEREL